MSNNNTRKLYMSVLDVNGQYNNSQLIHDWNLTSDGLKNLTSVLSELTDIRDDYKECDGLTCDNINAFDMGFVHPLIFCVVLVSSCFFFTIINIDINTSAILILHTCVTYI